MKVTIKMALAVTTLSILMPRGPVCAQTTGTTNQPTAVELQRLQGSWEGVGKESAGKISLTITDNSLRFQGLSTNDWYETTFTLPAGTAPEQLHATIKGCPQPDAIGKVVFAIFKIEDGTLTLAGIQDSAVEPPKTFEEDKSLFKVEDATFNFVGRKPSVLDGPLGFEDNSIFRYDLKKVQLQKKVTQPPKTK
jgi:hypothetical protein